MRYRKAEGWREILVRDKNICQYCGFPADGVDHVIPRSSGGSDLPENLVACCTSCNCFAGVKLFSNFDEKRDFILTKRRPIIVDIVESNEPYYEAL